MSITPKRLRKIFYPNVKTITRRFRKSGESNPKENPFVNKSRKNPDGTNQLNNSPTYPLGFLR